MVYMAPVSFVTLLRWKRTLLTVLLKSVFPLASNVSMVTFIVCSSVARKKQVDEPERLPTAALMLTVLLKPVLTVASPVVGLKLLPPAESVMRTLLAAAALLSEDSTRNFATIRLSVALISTALPLLLVTFTVWVFAKVSTLT